jgi:L-ascorbate oxidase
MTVHQNIDGYITWSTNHYPWTITVPTEPYLVSLYKNDSIEFPNYQRALKNNGLDPVTRAFPARIGEVLEIVIQNTGSDSKGLDSHLYHAHGRHYYDIGSGNGTYDAAKNEARLAGTNPVLRDSTMLYRYETSIGNGTLAGWRAWRLRATEPGAWMIHCHILQHIIM